VLPKVLAVEVPAGAKGPIKVWVKLDADEPSPCKVLDDKSVETELGLISNVIVPRLSVPRKEQRATKSVKVCGIEVNSIEAAAAPRVFV
jgi:hypothetical protein